ncbi:DUF1990 domain-containing protein [Micrococcaceae bacterium Sec5.7]
MTGQRMARGELNYPGIGSTEHGPPPEGYELFTERVSLGHGMATYRRVAQGLLTWQLQKSSGLRVRTDNASVVTGARVVSGFGVGPFRINAPCEVVWIRQPVPGDGPQSAGFGYGTLPGHPERGEEAFEVAVDAEGRVFFKVTSFSRHSNWFYRAGGALAKRAQRFITSRYIESAHELAAGEC